MSRKLIDLTGKRFGSWTVLRRMDENYSSLYGKHTIPQWLCRCDCGEYGIVLGNNLRSGQSTCCQRCRDDKRTAGLREYHLRNRSVHRSMIYEH